jgi:TetR/AcrR family transcriptional repressor of nem operon
VATSIDQLCHAAVVTKGASFDHFVSKETLGVAAAHHWNDVTTRLFAQADYHHHPDPLQRILGYLDFRAALAQGPLEQISCFAGTTVQEAFASSDALREACGEAIFEHAQRLEADFQAALEKHPMREPVSAASLALHTQAVLQGGFVIAKARGNNEPLLDAISHLRRYITLLFGTASTH